MDSLQTYARGPDAFSACIPIASSLLTQDLLNFNFVSYTADIETGLHPFIITDMTAEHGSYDLEVICIYTLLP
jgi:hypothetical protein